MEPIERTATKMGKMGERSVQAGIGQIPKDEVQGEARLIRPLVIGISINGLYI